MTMNNFEILKQIGALDKETRTVDLGGYADKYAGQSLQCWVNPPALLEEYLHEEENNNIDVVRRRKAVAILFELPLEQVAALDDQLMLFLFVEGTKQYGEFHDALRKNSNGDSGPI